MARALPPQGACLEARNVSARCNDANRLTAVRSQHPSPTAASTGHSGRFLLTLSAQHRSTKESRTEHSAPRLHSLWEAVWFIKLTREWRNKRSRLRELFTNWCFGSEVAYEYSVCPNTVPTSQLLLENLTSISMFLHSYTTRDTTWLQQQSVFCPFMLPC